VTAYGILGWFAAIMFAAAAISNRCDVLVVRKENIALLRCVRGLLNGKEGCHTLARRLWWRLVYTRPMYYTLITEDEE